ncbi:MAG: hypothetical protein AB3N23_22175 [Paracoccaceae bacterium]
MTDGTGPVKQIVFVRELRQHRAMRVLSSILIACLVLTGCGPLSIFYKQGGSVARMQTDQTNCEVSALKDAPVANQIRQRPPVYIPGNRYCNSSGQCYYSPGYWVDGGVYTVDVNANLRGRVLTQCMARKGYRPVEIPPCPSSVSNQVPPAQTQKFPPLTQSSCAIKNRDGSWQIVSRG